VISCSTPIGWAWSSVYAFVFAVHEACVCLWRLLVWRFRSGRRGVIGRTFFGRSLTNTLLGQLVSFFPIYFSVLSFDSFGGLLADVVVDFLQDDAKRVWSRGERSVVCAYICCCRCQCFGDHGLVECRVEQWVCGARLRCKQTRSKFERWNGAIQNESI
jgi:hypothetical protein